MLISPAELRGRYLPADVDASLVTVHADGELAGFATSCNWTDPDDRAITWITLLVVHKDYRRRGLATGLINEVRDGGYRAGVYGIISAHPAACIALARVCGSELFLHSHHFSCTSPGRLTYVNCLEQTRSGRSTTTSSPTTPTVSWTPAPSSTSGWLPPTDRYSLKSRVTSVTGTITRVCPSRTTDMTAS